MTLYLQCVILKEGVLISTLFLWQYRTIPETRRPFKVLIIMSINLSHGKIMEHRLFSSWTLFENSIQNGIIALTILNTYLGCWHMPWTYNMPA